MPAADFGPDWDIRFVDGTPLLAAPPRGPAALLAALPSRLPCQSAVRHEPARAPPALRYLRIYR